MQIETNLNSPNSKSDLLLRQEEVAKILNLSPRTLEAWRHKGGGPRYLKLTPRTVRYRLADLLDWQQGLVRTSTSDLGKDQE